MKNLQLISGAFCRDECLSGVSVRYTEGVRQAAPLQPFSASSFDGCHLAIVVAAIVVFRIFNRVVDD